MTSNEMEQKTPVTNLITEERFRRVHKYEDIEEPSIRKRLTESLKCTKKTFINTFPITKWIPKYSMKRYFANDIIAGVTVAIMHIPHGLAYAPLGRVEPVVGFYMAIFPVFIYLIMGTSRHISIGTFAVLCAMVGQIVVEYEIPEKTQEPKGTNSTEQTPTEATKATYEPIAVGGAVCLMVGIWQAVLGFLRLGSFTVIMSESLISGFTTGAAFHVFSYQLKNLFGVNVSSFSGVPKLLLIYIDFFNKISTVNLVTLGISISSIIILLFFNLYLKPLIQKKFPKNKIPIPIELIIIILGILVSYFLDLSKNYDVKIVGHIPSGLPEPKVPPSKLLLSLIFSSFVVAIVAVAINLSLAKIFAKKDNYVINDNQELIAYGTANIFSSFFLCLPSAASLSRSSIQFSVGGKTQLASLFSIILIIFILLAIGFVFEPVPYCILSSIVVVTLQGLLMQIGDFPKIWKQSHWDGCIWLVTFLAVIILDLDIGLAVGIILSVIRLLFSTYNLKLNVLGQVPGTDTFLDLNHYKSARAVPDVLILQVIGSLNYSNSNKLENLVLDEFKNFSSSDSQTYVVLDMSMVSQIDPTSIDALRNIQAFLRNSNCELYLAHCNFNVYKTFKVCNLFSDIPKDQILASVANAVEYIKSIT